VSNTSSSSASPIGIAIIGLGTVGLRYIEQYQLHDGFEIVGGYDVSEAAASTAQERFGITLSTSAETLIEDPAVTAVYVAVPPLFHEHYVDLVVAAGKALMCEKPLGVDDAESAGMVERVEAAGTRAAVNYVFGAAPSAVRLLSDVAASGDSIHGVDLRVHFEEWPRAWQAGAGWLRDRDQGGWAREVISHYVFLMLRLFDGPVTVEQCSAYFPADGTSEQRLVALLRADGVPIHVLGSSDSAGADEVEFTVRGTSQSWRLTNWYQYATTSRGGEWTPGLSDEEAAGPAAYAAQLGQLTALVNDEPQTLATFAEALEVQRIVERMLEIAAEAG
jgi:predicted dehydrogenase